MWQGYPCCQTYQRSRSPQLLSARLGYFHAVVTLQRRSEPISSKQHNLVFFSSTALYLPSTATNADHLTSRSVHRRHHFTFLLYTPGMGPSQQPALGANSGEVIRAAHLRRRPEADARCLSSALLVAPPRPSSLASTRLCRRHRRTCEHAARACAPKSKCIHSPRRNPTTPHSPKLG